MQQNWANPSQSFVEGMGIGNNIANVYQQKQRQELMSQAMAKIRNPNATSEDYYNAMLMSDKDTAQKIQSVFSARKQEQNEESLKSAAPMVYALKSGDANTAIALMERSIQENRDKGNNEAADFLESTKEAAKINPDAVGNMLAGMLTLTPGGKDVLGNILALSKDRREETKSKLDIAKTGADIAKTSSDIDKNNNDINMSKQQRQIALMQLDANNLKDKIDVETNELKKKIMEVELVKKNKEITKMDKDLTKTDKEITKIDKDIKRMDIELITGKTTIEASIDGIKAARNTLDEMLSKTMSLKATTGNVSGNTPTLLNATRDFRVLAENLGHQLKLVNIEKMKGMGSLSDGEGKALENAMGSLDLRSSPEQYAKILRTIKFYLDLAEQRANDRLEAYGPDVSGDSKQSTGDLNQENEHDVSKYFR